MGRPAPAGPTRAAWRPPPSVEAVTQQVFERVQEQPHVGHVAVLERELSLAAEPAGVLVLDEEQALREPDPRDFVLRDPVDLSAEVEFEEAAADADGFVGPHVEVDEAVMLEL